MKKCHTLSGIFTIIVFATLIFNNAFAQQTFQKTYGGSSDEYGYTTQQLSDGGYIMCGRTISYGVGGFDNYLLRLDAAGDTVWTKTYGNVGYDEAQNIVQTSDGGFIMTGQTDNINFAGDVYLVKTDASGVVAWSTAFGGAGTADFGYCVRQTSDGGYIVFGLTASAGAGGRDMLLVKTNSSGAVQWSKTYGGASDDEGRTVEETADGGFILAGFTQSYSNGYQAYVVKTNSSGVVTWSKNFGGGGLELGYSIKQTSDVGYILAGYTDSYGAGGRDVLLMKLTSAGAISWSKTYGGSGDDYGLNVKITSDGGFAIAGRTASNGDADGDYFLVKTSSTGTHEWSKAYGGANVDQAGNMIQTADGGYLLTGYTTSFGAGIRDAYLVKTDANGNSGCSEVTASTTTGSPTVTNGTGATEGTGPSTNLNPVTATRRSNSQIGVECESGGCNTAASFTSSATSVCVGTTVDFTNTSTNATSYQWKENGVLFSSSTDASRTFNTNGTFIIRLVAINGSCKDSVTTSITVNALPSATITPTGNTTFCQGGSVTLTSSSGGSYLWSPGGATTQSISATSQGSYTVTVTTNNCSATSGQTTVTVNQAPTAAITPSGATSFCDGGNVTLTASAANSYLWSPGGETTQSIAVTDVGNYSVTVTGGNNCQATSTQTAVVVYTLPAAPSISFDATFLQSGSATGNQWYLLGNPTPLGNGQTYTATQGGDYYFIYTDNNGCSVSSDTVNITITGFATNNANPLVVIYPNPTSGNIYVETLFIKNGSIKIEISNLEGQLIYSINEHVSAGNYRKNAELNFAPGIYNLSVETPEGRTIQKIEIIK